MLFAGTTQGLHDLDARTSVVEGRSVTALAPGPTGWHALLDRRVVVRLDHGRVSDVGEIPAADGQSLAVLTDGAVVVGRTGARLALVGAQVEELSAFEALPGREHWENPAGPTPDTRSLVTSGEDLWVNVHVGGLWVSRDRGRNWDQVIDPEADVHEVRAQGETLAVASAVGFGWSEDAGHSWSWSTEGLDDSYLRSVCLDGRTTFVSASDGPFTKHGAVFRARLGSPFVRCEGGLPASFPGNVDTGHLDAGDGRVAIGFGHEIYLSEDDGGSWRAQTMSELITTVRLGRD